MSSTTPHYSLSRTILADVIPLRTPYSIQIEASQKCNLKCNYCIHSFGKNVGKKLMMFPTFQEICKQMGEFDDKIKQVNFSGWGEPLMNRTLPLMIEHLRDANIAENVAIVTNGLLLTPDISLALVKAGVDHIRISLQGLLKEKYWNICHKKIDFIKFIDNIAFLYAHKSGCQLSVKIADVALDDGDEEYFYDTFRNISDRMYIEYIRPMFTEDEQDGKVMSKFGHEHKPVIVCPQPFFMLAVTAVGDVIPCCSYYQPEEFGNVNRVTLREIWKSKRMLWLQKEMLQEERKDIDFTYPVCSRCPMPDAIILPDDDLDSRAAEIRDRL